METSKPKLYRHDEVVGFGVPVPDENVPKNVRMGWLPPYPKDEIVVTEFIEAEVEDKGDGTGSN